MNNELIQRVSDYLKMTLAKDYTSVSYAVSVGGEVVLADALGWQDKPAKIPAGTNCTYNVASVSKIYCTAAIMILVQQDKISLDEPVITYVPDFKMLDEDYKKITVRHLLNHASGLPGTQWKGFSVTQKTERNYHQEVLDYLAISHLKAKPGAYSVYCNDGFTLAEIVVARVSGMSFGEFVRLHITDPIGALSTRYIENRNEEYPLVREKKKPAELLLVEGAGGVTTTMTDLCRFGQLFLSENPILSDASTREMAKMQGVSFLKEDQKSLGYGLGWDTVCYADPQFDLGQGVLVKGGNSFQFTTQFIVIPKYKAVLAISETHDCKIDVAQAVLHAFALWMQETRGISIYTQIKPIPEEFCQKYSGTYLMPSMIMKIEMQNGTMNFQETPAHEEPSPMQSYLRFDGHRWIADENQNYFFAEGDSDCFLMTELKGRSYPMAMKAKSFAPLSDAWKSRMGVSYIVTNATPEDLVIGEIMTGFTLSELSGFEGIMIASFSGRKDSDVYSGGFDGSFIAVDDQCGRGFLQTPCNGSRDLIDPRFTEVNGAEHCDSASYHYQKTGSLPLFQAQDFTENCQAYRIEKGFGREITIPQGRRLMELDQDMNVVWDSMKDETPIPDIDGYLLLI